MELVVEEPTAITSPVSPVEVPDTTRQVPKAAAVPVFVGAVAFVVLRQWAFNYARTNAGRITLGALKLGDVVYKNGRAVGVWITSTGNRVYQACFSNAACQNVVVNFELYANGIKGITALYNACKNVKVCP